MTAVWTQTEGGFFHGALLPCVARAAGNIIALLHQSCIIVLQTCHISRVVHHIMKAHPSTPSPCCLCSSLQAVLWGWAELGRLCHHRAAGTAASLWPLRLLLPPAQSPKAGWQGRDHQKCGGYTLSAAYPQFCLVAEDLQFQKIHPFFSSVATEEDGRSHQEVPDPQQWDICYPEQVHEGSGDGQFHCGACSLFPASYTPIPGYHLLKRPLKIVHTHTHKWRHIPLSCDANFCLLLLFVRCKVPQ